jgi:hypothetical protein
MSSHQKCESDVTAATAFLPPELGRHWTKRLAHKMGVPVDTARHWIFRSMPAARRREIAFALIAECDRLEVLIADTRRRWEGVANDETTGAVARGEADRARAPARRLGSQGGS